jgi:hypothetical protein
MAIFVIGVSEKCASGCRGPGYNHAAARENGADITIFLDSCGMRAIGPQHAMLQDDTE